MTTALRFDSRGFNFQLPLSGSLRRVIEAVNINEAFMLSTPSLGITKPAYVVIPWAAKLKAFNSLSRDHGITAV